MCWKYQFKLTEKLISVSIIILFYEEFVISSKFTGNKLIPLIFAVLKVNVIPWEIEHSSVFVNHLTEQNLLPEWRKLALAVTNSTCFVSQWPAHAAHVGRIVSVYLWLRASQNIFFVPNTSYTHPAGAKEWNKARWEKPMERVVNKTMSDFWEQCNCRWLSFI